MSSPDNPQRRSPDVPGPVPATAPALTARPPRPPSRRLSLPPLPPASPRARGIVLGRKHTLLEPQIKGGIPRPASQWSLCAEESLRGARAQAEREGPEEGAQDKDTCHPETLMFKEAPGGGWTPARCRKMQMEKSRCVQKKTLVPVVSEGGDINGWVHGLQPSAGPCRGWAQRGQRPLGTMGRWRPPLGHRDRRKQA